jgi:rare lipoprotein A
MYAMTAAHTVLPIPSYARVTHLGNGRSVVVRINDRGPFHSDRIIDLSYAAAHRLGIVGAGSARVEVETIFPERSPHPARLHRNDPIARLLPRISGAMAATLACAAFAAEPQPPAVAARAWMLVDLTSGQTITSRNPDERIEPASPPSS